MEGEGEGETHKKKKKEGERDREREMEIEEEKKKEWEIQKETGKKIAREVLNELRTMLDTPGGVKKVVDLIKGSGKKDDLISLLEGGEFGEDNDVFSSFEPSGEHTTDSTKKKKMPQATANGDVDMNMKLSAGEDLVIEESNEQHDSKRQKSGLGS